MKKSKYFVLFFLLMLFQITSMKVYGNEATTSVRIGVSLSLSGKYADMGKFQKMAYQLCESQVNQRGGFLGRPIQFIIRDDKSDPTAAAKIYQQYVDSEKLDFVLGPYSSPITAAVAPITEKASYPMLSGGGSSDELWDKDYKFLFGIMPLAGRYPIGFLDLLSEAHIQRIAVIAIEDNFPLTAAKAVKQWAPDYKLEIVNYQVLPKDKPDMVIAATQARKSGAQAVILAGYLNDSIEMRLALKKIGWTPKAYYASVGPAQTKYRETLGADAHNAFSTSLWEPREDLRRPGSLEFLKAFRAKFNENPIYQSATAYAACQVLEQAVLKAKTTDRAAVHKALTMLDTNTIIGRYSVDRTGRTVKSFPFITQWQSDKKEIVWPHELRTAKAVFNQ